ncbi:MAG: hypothetical protein QHH18_04390 [Candidatus Bathyarchaeota archaeon]|jgi:hypothetical protein|nr:hypothetical protein [Candidatus Bathyarchaeota archaeon A05DMB-5]MDH7557826.1 hypothetical protein [Candidatus Bathyarchaeota archaeon]
MVLRKTELTGLEPIQDIVELTLWTAYVKNEKPVSLMLLAEPESGKTELLKKYRKNNGVYSVKRFSAYGIQKDLIEGKLSLLFDNPKILGHIMIYDFSAIWTFKPSSIDNTIAFLDALTEEGLSPESDYAFEYDALKPFEGVKGGIIAAINTQGFFTPTHKQIKTNLLKGGFFSRMVLVSFGTSETLLQKIFENVKEGKYRPHKDYVSLIPLSFPRKRIDVRIPRDHAEDIKEIVDDIKDEINADLKVELKGIRLFKSLITLAKASALRDGRRVVDEKDVERIRYLSHWMNLRMNNLKRKYPLYERDEYA